MTDWEQFAKLDLQKLRAVMKLPIVIDGRNLFNPSQNGRVWLLVLQCGTGAADHRNHAQLYGTGFILALKRSPCCPRAWARQPSGASPRVGFDVIPPSTPEFSQLRVWRILPGSPAMIFHPQGRGCWFPQLWRMRGTRRSLIVGWVLACLLLLVLDIIVPRLAL